MYSVVLAAMLTTSPATPQWGHGHGCWACYGCYGCYGGWGYGWGGWGWGYPAYAGYYAWPSYYGCYGAFGCAGGGYACIGCYGCYGWGGYVASAAPVRATTPAPGAPDVMPRADGAAPAIVTVQLPPGAKLFAEGKAVTLNDNGSFTSPRLEFGESYVYTLKAQVVRDGRLVTETKDIRVRANETTRVAFADLQPAVAAAAPKNEAPASAHITVKLGENAKLFVNGVPCPTRAFDTPKLDPERAYSYTLKAEYVREGQPKVETKVVTFRAGQPVTVDFGTPDVRAASR